MWEKEKAVTYLDSHAHAQSLGHCAEYVRRAIEAGGVILIRHTSAKDYGSSLTIAGFVPVLATPVLAPLAGDVAIIQPIPGHPDGHMTMFDGTSWISDFKQAHGLYPGPTYRKLKPSVVVYRYPG
jgi:hypothetical protein